ncbi:MAG: hypothetical protein OEZ01_02630 [Candidatus Heimdallarchaeota archaeon]|nr:hypothetical protein [Candidatus Heimdallarchaeota archaeon]MDH5644872.1 hypothetical protein [Candidatus Heimdallarchaeota archaeon]
MTKILIPIQIDHGRDSIASGHLGGAPKYFIANLENEEQDIILPNTSKKFGGTLPPIQLILNAEPDYVFSKGACGGAFTKLSQNGIGVYEIGDFNIKDAISKFKENQLEKITEGSHGSCNH